MGPVLQGTMRLYYSSLSSGQELCFVITLELYKYLINILQDPSANPDRLS